MSAAPLVTVVVLTYDQVGFVERCLDGVLGQQTDFPVRVVVHDDASTDGTQDVLRAVAARHPDVHLVLQTTNQLSQGVSITARLLLDVDTEFVAFCEGDDLWTSPHKLQRQVEFMRGRRWCTVSHHEFTILNDGGRSDYEATLRSYLAGLPWRTAPRAPGARLALGNFVRTCTAMVRRDALRDEVLRAAHDVRPGDHLFFCLAAEKGDVGFIPQDMATYRLHPGNSWAQLDAEQRILKQLGVYWFLGAHLRGPMQLEVQQVLFRLLMSSPVLTSRYDALDALARRNDELSRVGLEVAGALEALMGEKEAVAGRLAAVERECEELRTALSAR